MGENKSRSNGETPALHYTAAQDCSADSDTTEISALGEDDYVDELAETGEFAPLTVGAESDAPPTDERRASFVLTHLESEIERLQARWEGVESELQARETVIEELARCAKNSEAAMAELRGDVVSRDAQLAAAAKRLEQTSARVDELEAARRDLEARIAERDTQLAAQHGDLEAAERRLTDSKTELGRITAQIESLRAEGLAAAEREAESRAETEDLRRTIQELETYIDGRRQHWTQLNAKVAEYQDELLTLERGVAERNDRLTSASADKASLEEKVAALEHDLAARDEQLRGHEETRQRTEAELRERLARAQRLQAELDERSRQLDDALTRLASREEAVARLEQTIAEGDRSMNELRSELADVRSENQRSLTLRDELSAAAARFEAALAERDGKIAALLESSDSVETALGASEKRVEKLEGLLAEAGKEMAALQESLAAAERRGVRLAEKLRDKQRALDLLERSAARLDHLGASLEGVDRRFSGPPTKVLSADLRPGKPAILEAESPATVVKATVRRRMIVTLDGEERTSYPLRGTDVTIGRSAESDIRLRSPFVSRLHARISMRDAKTLIEDLGSKNGVLLNSNPIDRTAALHDGDIISLGGRLALKYVDREEAIGDPLASRLDEPSPLPPG
jgi:pSer/pThr/pTyr-binding forkhead associated (FHA) protein/peptidoglycan hydrolase CwlO-like protein